MLTRLGRVIDVLGYVCCACMVLIALYAASIEQYMGGVVFIVFGGIAVIIGRGVRYILANE